jgi:hypothetical protein
MILFIKIKFLLNQMIIEIDTHILKKINWIKSKEKKYYTRLHILKKNAIILCENQVKIKWYLTK